jgi:hypothetical protein
MTEIFSIILWILLFLIFGLPMLAGAIFLIIAAYVESSKILLSWTDPEEYARREALSQAIEQAAKGDRQ